MAPNMTETKKPNRTYIKESRQVLGVAFELGFIIALPITLFALLGRHFNQRYNVSYFLYIGIALAVIFTSIWVYRRFAAMVKALEDAAGAVKQTSSTQTEKEKTE
jgi:hypothetical protein